MEAFLDFAITTVTSAGVSASLLAVIGWLGRSWISERLKGAIKHEYDDRLETLKAELKVQGDAHLASLRAEVDRQAEKLRIAAASFSEVQKATITKKIEAVDALWLGVIQARKAFPAIVSMTDIFTDEEMTGFYTHSSLKQYSVNMSTISPAEYIEAGYEKVEQMRPHLGEVIWALYVANRAILGRSIVLLKRGEEEPNKIAWHQDKNIKMLVASAFGETACQEFEALKFARYQWLTSQFDHQLFKAIDTLLTGKSFSRAALLQAQEMEALIRSSTRSATELNL